MRAFNISSAIAITLASAAALLSLAGIAATGFYPGIVVFFGISTLALGIRRYGRARPHVASTLIILNVLIIFVTLWMLFVIVHDRILNDCC